MIKLSIDNDKHLNKIDYKLQSMCNYYIAEKKAFLNCEWC